MKFIKHNYLYEQYDVITQTQTATILETIGYAYKIKLEYTPEKVIALYLDYENNPIDYNGEIIFEFEGEQQTVQAVNGVAEIPFVVVDAGTYVVRTANPDIENGEVTINA